MARSFLRRRAAGMSILALVLLGLSQTQAFTVPSVPGVSAFAGSAPARSVGSTKIAVAIDNRRNVLRAQDGVFGVAMAAVRNPQLIGTPIPRSWSEGTDFIRDGRKIGKGDLVIIKRSDGR